MEKIHCDGCNQPTFHQTKNAYGDQIHQQGIKCLICGQFSGEPDNVVRLPQKALWRVVGDEAVKWL
jgi:hypothetical protein